MSESKPPQPLIQFGNQRFKSYSFCTLLVWKLIHLALANDHSEHERTITLLQRLRQVSQNWQLRAETEKPLLFPPRFDPRLEKLFWSSRRFEPALLAKGTTKMTSRRVRTLGFEPKGSSPRGRTRAKVTPSQARTLGQK